MKYIPVLNRLNILCSDTYGNFIDIAIPKSPTAQVITKKLEKRGSTIQPIKPATMIRISAKTGIFIRPKSIPKEI